MFKEKEISLSELEVVCGGEGEEVMLGCMALIFTFCISLPIALVVKGKKAFNKGFSNGRNIDPSKYDLPSLARKLARYFGYNKGYDDGLNNTTMLAEAGTSVIRMLAH